VLSRVCRGLSIDRCPVQVFLPSVEKQGSETKRRVGLGSARTAESQGKKKERKKEGKCYVTHIRRPCGFNMGPDQFIVTLTLHCMT
jgi:hypothetical protein